MASAAGGNPALTSFVRALTTANLIEPLNTTPEQSVADMRRLIERLGPDESGCFFERDGSRHQW